MQCCDAVRGEQQIPLNFEWRGEGSRGVWIVLFLRITLFEDNVCGRVLRIKQAPVIPKVDNALHRIIHYPVDSNKFLIINVFIAH